MTITSNIKIIDIQDELRELFDAIELGHCGDIYDTGDYREVMEEMLSKINTYVGNLENDIADIKVKADLFEKLFGDIEFDIVSKEWLDRELEKAKKYEAIRNMLKEDWRSLESKETPKCQN